VSKRGKRKRRKARKVPLVPLAWGAAALAAVIGVVLVVLVASEGGSGPTGATVVTRTPDPRVAGLTPSRSFRIEAGDSGQGTGFFRPTTVEAEAGEVIEIVVENVGSVAHNWRVSGPDRQFDTPDDFEIDRFSLQPGETGRAIVKIDEPGSYPFRCDFHPQQQVGTLVLR
jgi:uncharacterized cupredoxin-like copper-binding protein